MPADRPRSVGGLGEARFVEGLHRADHERDVLRSRRLHRGVHRELGQADVGHRDGHGAGEDVAERSAADHVGAVVEDLGRDVRAPADLPEERRRHCGRRVFLVRCELHDHAAVQRDRVGRVGLLGMVRMGRVAVVDRQEERVRLRADGILRVQAVHRLDPRHHVRQERARRALARLGADLLVVEHRPYVAAVAAFGLFARAKEAVERRRRGREVVDPRGEVEVLVRADDGRVLVQREDEIEVDDLRALREVRRRLHGVEEPFRRVRVRRVRSRSRAVRFRRGPGRARDRLHIGAHVQLRAEAPFAVEVAAERRDHEQRVRRDENGRDPVLRPDEQPARDAERPVDPRRPARSAILLDPRFAVSGAVRVRLRDAERRAVGMGAGPAPAAEAVRRHPPGDDRRAVARRIVAAAGREAPDVALAERRVARPLEPVRRRLHRVKRRQPLIQEFQTVFQFVVHLRVSILRICPFIIIAARPFRKRFDKNASEVYTLYCIIR